MIGRGVLEAREGVFLKLIVFYAWVLRKLLTTFLYTIIITGVFGQDLLIDRVYNLGAVQGIYMPYLFH